jgi:hypothetical protein
MALHVTISSGPGISNQIHMGPETQIKSLRSRVYATSGFSQESTRFSINGASVSDENQSLGSFVRNDIACIEATGTA